MKYLTPKEAAEKWGISRRRVHTLCLEGRIKGAERHGWTWLIPDTSPKPADARSKSRQAQDNGNTAGQGYPVPLGGDTAMLPRPHLVEKLCPPHSKLTYIHADAGHGKTTLLTQYAKGRRNVVWLTLDERDNDPLFFLSRLEAAIRQSLKELNFYTTDYIPFVESATFVPSVSSALLKAIGKRKLSILMDDLQVIHNDTVIKLLTALAVACPPNLSLLMASRHELWSSLLPLKMAGGVTELTRQDLCFSREETKQLWGFFDEAIYAATEGWILAIQSYRLATKDGRMLPTSRLQADQELYRYLLKEILQQLPVETQHFLKATSGLPVLEPRLCNTLLNIENAQRILESLVHHNLFTVRVTAGSYRYHALFRAFLQQNDEGLGTIVLRQAMKYYYTNTEYTQAADYALLLRDTDTVQDCIGALLAQPFTWNRTHSLKKYLDFLDQQSVELFPRTMLAKGMVLSDQGNFYQAEKCLRKAIPQLNSNEQHLYLHAMTHMARVLRNRVSFEESNRCLDTLLPLLNEAPMQEWYGVMIEKIHNLTLTSHLTEALELIEKMMEKCLACGELGVKAWFERYLTAVYFFMGDYGNCVKAYEKSLSIPREEQEWLMRHSVGAYAAKAYQITGQEEKALPLLEAEIRRLKELGLYEEYSINYLLQAEVLHAIELLKYYQGKPARFSIINHYLSLAEEYALLNRSTRDHHLFVQIWRLSSVLLAQPEKVGQYIEEALSFLENTTPFIQSLACGRMANALDILGLDMEQCKRLFHQSIQIGEKIGSYAYATVAYGRLAAIYLREGDLAKAKEYTRCFLELSRKYNHRYYIRFQTLFEPVMKLAVESNICPGFTRDLLSYGDYVTKQVYINTLGNFYVAPAHDKDTPVRIRTMKARELLAYLLEHPKGVTRAQITTDLWADSDADVPNLFHTRRGEIRQSFEALGASNPILYENERYYLNREEISCDHDLFWQAVEEFRQSDTPENAETVVNLYTGRYLDNLEALWAENSRLKYEESFLEAAEVLLTNYRITGEKTKAQVLLRRCKSLSYYGHRYEQSP